MKSKSICRLVVALWLLTASSPNSVAAQSRAEAVLSLSPQTEYITASEPLYVALAVENRSSERVRFNLGLNRKQNIEFIITGPGETVRSVSLPSGGTADGNFGLVGRVDLEPHDTYTQRLLFNEWYAFRQPGHYTVELQSNLIESAGFLSGSARFEVDVRPRDEVVLWQVCSDLVTEALSSTASGSEAATALAYINDPVAIPFLNLLLESGEGVEDIAVEGLGRIGTREAVDVLIAYAGISNTETRLSIARVLSRVEGESSDAALSSRIRLALDSMVFPGL